MHCYLVEQKKKMRGILGTEYDSRRILLCLFPAVETNIIVIIIGVGG